ncbi:MAG: alpha/beta fold hydrolase [Actinobacteria bacterium]|nr:alpha/beta fold hydrolase [Actinomycetota bacterium]
MDDSRAVPRSLGLETIPFNPEEVAPGAHLEVRCECFHTGDGVTLRLKRYAREGAQPVILVHGYTGNGLEFDLPHRRHNLALFLAERGYDVWIANFRGCGRWPYHSDTNGWLHSVDHLAALDAPALVDGVSLATGKKPVWIGHSMGGMVLYMYLAGARMTSHDGGCEVSLDPALAAERNRALLGGITIGSPPAFHHGGGAWVATLSRLPFFDATVRMLIRLCGSLETASPRFPVSRLGDLVARFPRLGMVLAMHGPIAVFLYNRENVYPEVGCSLLRWASDNVTARMTRQILSLVRDRDFRDYRGACSYTERMADITLPLLFITGTLDFVGAENIRTHGYELVAGERKRFENLTGYGHTDLVMGKRVYEEVYPLILSWLEELGG